MKEHCNYSRMILLGLMLLSVLFCALLAGCEKEAEPEGEKVSIYFLNNAETKIEAVEYYLQTSDKYESLQELQKQLGSTPSKKQLKGPLNMGISVLSMKVDGEKLLIDMNEAYYKLLPTTEVLFRAALVKTFTQLQDITYVGITIEGKQLFDALGEQVGWMNAEQFIQNDGNEINTYELAKMKLYFANSTGDKLIATYREKHYSTNTPLERLILEELIAGPSGQIEGIHSVINPQTKIINVMTKDGICYVNLDSSFLTVVEKIPTELSVYAIVNSLVELKYINKVQILINGESSEHLSATAYERKLEYITTLDAEKALQEEGEKGE